MRWFKHFSDSLDDPFVQSLLDKFGPSGYLAWFGLIEIIAKENKKQLTGRLEIDPSYLRRKLRISLAKLERIFNHCSTNAKLSFRFSGENWSFDFPKILQLKDEYTRKSGHTPDNVPPHTEEEGEEEEKEKDPPNPPTEAGRWIDFFGKAYQDRFNREHTWRPKYRRLAAEDERKLPHPETWQRLLKLWFDTKPDEFIKKYQYGYVALHHRLDDILAKLKEKLDAEKAREEAYRHQQERLKAIGCEQAEEKARRQLAQKLIAELTDTDREVLRQEAQNNLQTKYPRLYGTMAPGEASVEYEMERIAEERYALPVAQGSA